MNRDLFLSILAMDSYNRGYGAGLNGLNETGFIGGASIRPFGENEQAGWQNTGFFAIAYQLNGQKIISYRGTNFDLEGGRESELAKDAFNGWTLGAGFSSATQTLQAYLARRLSRRKSPFILDRTTLKTRRRPVLDTGLG